MHLVVLISRGQDGGQGQSLQTLGYDVWRSLFMEGWKEQARIDSASSRIPVLTGL